MSETPIITVEVTPRMLALISMIRSLENGMLTEVIVRHGEPVVVKGGVQRIDLEREDELKAALDGRIGKAMAVDFAARPRE